MYSVSGTRWTPYLIHLAYQGNYTPLTEWLLEHNRVLETHLHWGLLLSVTCSEDVPRIDPATIQGLTSVSYARDDRVRMQMAACQIWPRGEVPDSYGDPVTSDVPVLLWSGTLDPVVPPKWGEAAARHLSNSLHLVVPSAHSVDGSCFESVNRRFVQRPSILDDYSSAKTPGADERPPLERRTRSWTSCVEGIRLPPFEIPGG